VQVGGQCLQTHMKGVKQSGGLERCLLHVTTCPRENRVIRKLSAAIELKFKYFRPLPDPGGHFVASADNASRRKR
jgi:hypothetical protein